MHLFVAVRQSLTAMDAVIAKIARAMGLRSDELWVVMVMVSTGDAVSGAWLATISGRSRQQLHRTLRGLEARGLVLGVSEGARASRWVLTDAGLERGQRLRPIVSAWEQMMRGRVDLDELSRELERVVASLVNHFSSHGWREGLHVPWEVRRGDLPIDGSPPWHEVDEQVEQADLFAQRDQPHGAGPGDLESLVDDGERAQRGAEAVLIDDNERPGSTPSVPVLIDDSEAESLVSEARHSHQ